MATAMRLRGRLAALGALGLLLLGATACQPDETIEGTNEPVDGGDAGEGAEPQGGVGEEGAEGEGPLDEEEPLDG
jgi:hypothetical protein